MTRSRSQRRRILAAAAIAGAALLASAGLAAADPGYDPGGYGPDGYGHAPYDYYGDRYDSHGNVDYDLNGDGYLSPRERARQRADLNHDGRLDPRERRLLERELVRRRWYDGGGWDDPWAGPGSDRSPQHLAEHDLNGDGHLDRWEMRELRRHDRIEDIFYSFDRNGDRVLSYWEIQRSPIIAYFRNADHDGDGHVTFAELDHYVDEPEQHRPSWGASWSWSF